MYQYENIKFCGDGKVTDLVTQIRAVTRDFYLSPHLFNIFVDDMTEYLNEENRHDATFVKMMIPCLFAFADDLPIGTFTVNESQKKLTRW